MDLAEIKELLYRGFVKFYSDGHLQWSKHSMQRLLKAIGSNFSLESTQIQTILQELQTEGCIKICHKDDIYIEVMKPKNLDPDFFADRTFSYANVPEVIRAYMGVIEHFYPLISPRLAQNLAENFVEQLTKLGENTKTIQDRETEIKRVVGCWLSLERYQRRAPQKKLRPLTSTEIKNMLRCGFNVSYDELSPTWDRKSLEKVFHTKITSLNLDSNEIQLILKDLEIEGCIRLLYQDDTYLEVLKPKEKIINLFR